jgi:transposase InsO family protein
MPWQERTVMSERQEFIAFARQEGTNIAALCRHVGISRKTAYKWLARAEAGETGFADRSRRPHHSPGSTPAAVEAAVVALRQEHPAWGGRKLHHALAREGMVPPPAPSTITAILRRHELLSPEPAPRAFVRFEHAAPNDLWQLDLMGHRGLDAGRVHPLTLLDDHSRFALSLTACANEQQTVVEQLTAIFRRYGLPRAILCDNGSPWAPAREAGLTRLEAWWLQLGIEPWHGRVYHPQTQGKVERFHGTIAAEVFAQRQFPDLATAQTAFDRFRTTYNHKRPHEALEYAVPAERYQPSVRPFPETLPEIVYGPDDTVRIVTIHGSIQWQGRRHFVSRGLVGQPVAVRPTQEDGRWEISFCHRSVAIIDRRVPEKV